MTTVMVILIAAGVGYALSHWWRLPAIPLLILVGVVLSATGLAGDSDTIRSGLLLGLTFLMFVVGSELDPGRTRGRWGLAFAVAAAHFLVLATLGLFAAWLLFSDWLAAGYFALAVTASSTLLVVSLLRQRQQLFEPMGRIIVGAMLIQDLLLLALLTVLVRVPDGPAAIASGLGGACALVLLTLICRRWVSPAIFLKFGLDDESTLLVILAVLFGFLGLTHLLGLPLITGAFLAGVGLSKFPVNGVVRGHLLSLADFFVTVFFVTLGALIVLPGWRQLVLEALVIAGVLLLIPPLIMAVLRRAGMTFRASIEGGHLIAQCGEFGLIVILVGVQQGHVGEELLATFIVVAVVSMSLTPWLSHDSVTWRLMRWISRDEVGRPERPPRGHVLMLGCGRSLRDRLIDHIPPDQQLLVVDDDAGVVADLRKRGVTAVRGDGADFRLLRSVGARDARVVICTMRRMEDRRRLLRFVSGPHVVVRVFDSHEAKALDETGATIIIEADAATDALLRWLEQSNARTQST